MRPSQLSLIDMLTIGLPATILAIMPNNKPIQGRFMFNVLKNALPGALVVFVNAAVIYLCSYYFPSSIEKEAISTMITISTAVTCLLVLLRVFFPINAFKVLLFFAIAGILGFLIFNDLSLAANGGEPLFYFVKLHFPEGILLIALCEASYPLILIFSLSFTNAVKKFIRDEYQLWINRDSDDDDDIEDEEDISEEE